MADDRIFLFQGHILVNNEGSRSKDELEERLPDSVRQARERLLLRLRSVNLSGSRSVSHTLIWINLSLFLALCIYMCFIWYEYNYAIQQDLWKPYYLYCRETDTDLGNQQITCQPQSDVVHSLYEFTKRPILEISQVIRGIKCIIFRTASECEITGTSFVECCICLERFLEGEELTQLNCKHTFHSRCLMRWVQAHSDCPYCRAPVS